MPRIAKPKTKTLPKITKPKTAKTVAEEIKLETAPKSAFGVTGVLAIIVVLGLFGLGANLAKSYTPKSTTSDIQEIAAAQTVSYDGEDGKNALDILKNKAEITTQDTSASVYVDAINGTKNSENHFWIMYVNDEMSQVGPDQYQTKNGDKIEWRYEQIF